MGEKTWVKRGDLAESLGLSDDELSGLLEDWDACGFAEAGELGVSVTAECLAAKVLRECHTPAGVCYQWAPDETMAVPVDEGLARRSKRDWVGRLRCDEGGLPLPSILESGVAAWDNVPRAVCPACKNRPLGPQVYCLRCDRWGLDAQPVTGKILVRAG